MAKKSLKNCKMFSVNFGQLIIQMSFQQWAKDQSSQLPNNFIFRTRLCGKMMQLSKTSVQLTENAHWGADFEVQQTELLMTANS